MSTVDEIRVDRERFMTVQEVADALNLTRRNVRKLQVPFYAVGRSPIYARKDLEEAGLIEPRVVSQFEIWGES